MGSFGGTYFRLKYIHQITKKHYKSEDVIKNILNHGLKELI